MKRVVLVQLCMLLTLCVPCFAQTVTGAVRGTITDSSGAILPGASVSAANLATGVKTETTTDKVGEYSLRFLQIGAYQLTVEMTGFKTATYGPFSLEIDQTAKVDVPLTVGSASTTLNVSEQLQPILNTESATLGETFTANTINSVPLNGRDFGQLTMYTPGAVAINFGLIGSQSSAERAYPGGTASEANINGNRQQQNNYLFDGQEINENVDNNIGYSPSPDALEQIRVIASNANAEFGNVAGGDVLMVMKSGSDRFHGSVFGFLQNTKLSANSWENDNNVVPIPQSPFTKTFLGGTIGGPILKGKLFFFADYEKFYFHSSGLGTYSVATQAMRTGDLSNLSALGLQLYDTQNVVNGQPVAYANNQINITNPVALYLFNHPEAYPLPNNPTADPSGIYNNYIGPQSSAQRNQQGDIKFDYHLHDNDVVSGRYSYGYAENYSPKVVIPVAFSFQSNYPDQFVNLSWIHTFSPALVNSARASYGRISTNHGVDTDPSGLFGLNGNTLVGITGLPQAAPGFSLQNFEGNGFGQASTIGSNQTPFLLTDNVFEYADNITWQRGHHFLKAGAQFLRYQQNYFYSGNNGDLGQFNYTGGYTGNPLTTTSQPGNPFADFLLDRVNQVQIGSTHGRVGQRQWRDAVFAQDDYKLSTRLTVNLGLRWEYNQPIYEVNNKQANINMQTGLIELAGVNGASRALYNPSYDQVMPRIGFAFQPKPRFVIRGGYGITSFLEGTGTNLRLTQNEPFHSNFQVTGQNPTSPGGTYSPGIFFTVTNGFPTQTPPITQFNVWPNLKPAVTQEMSLTTEYELSETASLQLGYVGILGHHLVIPVYANQLTSPTATAPYANIVGQNGSVFLTNTEGASNFNGLEVVFRQRLKAGMELTANYTLSKSLTDSAGFYGIPNSTSDGVPMNTYDLKSEWAPSATDVRHNLTVTAAYVLPFGRGRQFGSGLNRVADAALGGWKLSGSSVTYSGFPFTVNSPNNYSNLVDAIGAARPVQNRPLVVTGRTLNAYYGTAVQGTSCGPNQDNGTCVYSQEPNDSFGTVRPASLRAPGFNNLDMAVEKNFAVWHENGILFRADFFNAFNIASYGPPDNDMTDANFGQITGTRSTTRKVQLQLKYSF